jgi:hypothetical protein
MTDRIDPYYISQLEQIAKMIGWPRIIREAQARHDAEERMKPPEKYIPSAPFFDLRGEMEKQKVSLPEGFLAHPYESFCKDVDDGVHVSASLLDFLNSETKKTVIRSRIVRGEEAIKLAEEKGLVLRLFDEDEGNSKEISIAAAKSLRDDYQGPEYTLEKALKRVYVVERTTENFKQENE